LFFRNWDSFFSSINTIIINRIGDFILIFLIFLIFRLVINFNILNLIFIFLIISSFTKRAIFPFIVWLPKAIRAPTPISSLVHRRTLVTAGLFLLINYYYLLNNKLVLIIYLITLISIIFSGILRIVEKDLKKIIALRTLSQIGFCFLIFNLNFFLFPLIHLISHAFFKSNLFIQSGFLMYLNFNEQNKNKILNINKIFYLRFYLILLILIGLIFNRRIIRKDFLLELIFNFNLFFFNIIIIFITIIFSFIYCFILINIIKNNNYKLIYLNYKIIIYFSFFRIIFCLNLSFLIYYWINYLTFNLFEELSFILIYLIFIVFFLFFKIKNIINFIKLEFIILIFYNIVKKNFFFKINFLFLDIIIKFLEIFKYNKIFNVIKKINLKNNIIILIIFLLILI
jgi:NADH:ubiquinone oxidoreductase subunit 5 (subunit L)/multisubunit Na+/H+ antiporter MnhA subunit